jgi:hypothetical protein
MAATVIAAPAFAWPIQAIAQTQEVTLAPGESKAVDPPRRCLRVNSLDPAVVQASYAAPKIKLTAKKLGKAQVVCEDAAMMRFIIEVEVKKPEMK